MVSCEIMALKYEINTNRSFINVTSSEYLDITTTRFVYNHVNWNIVKYYIDTHFQVYKMSFDFIISTLLLLFFIYPCVLHILSICFFFL